MSNKFIVIEGGDGSGKTTQVGLLVAALTEQSVVIETIKFPRKEQFFGKFVYECLDGAHGDFLALDPHFGALPYALDQSRAREEIEQALLREHLIADRYAPSNLAHQAAKLEDEKVRREAIAFIEQMTYEELGAPMPDLTIYLDVPAKISAELQKRENKSDQHEANLAYQARVREVYRMLARERDDWRQIECAPGGILRPREDIQKEVMQEVLAVLGDSP
jgi:dTMP kinase